MNADMLFIIGQDDLRAVWPLVRDRIEKLRESGNEPWLAEDVYHELVIGASHLWITPDAGGFVVVSIMVAPYARDLHVWIACNDTIARAAEYWLQLRDIGRAHSCTRLIFESPRRWQRAVPGLTTRFLYSEQI